MLMNVGPSNFVIEHVCDVVESAMKHTPNSKKVLGRVIESISGNDKDYDSAAKFLVQAAKGLSNNGYAPLLMGAATFILNNKGKVPSSYGHEGATERHAQYLREQGYQEMSLEDYFNSGAY